jgi:hypothetical protein
MAFHWCEKDDLMETDGAEANKGGPWGLLKCGRSLIQWYGDSKQIRQKLKKC